MKTNVVYYSKFGNTRRIAHAIAAELQKKGEVHLIPLQELKPDQIQVSDLFIMGVPTHKMNLPQPVLPILHALPKKILEGIHVAAFDTSYQMSWFLNLFTASKRLLPMLRRLGGKSVTRPEVFLVSGREGPLMEGELDRAGAWARSIRERIKLPATPEISPVG